MPGAPLVADVFTTASERLRDALKWLFGALTAVGAALLAGLSLSSIGDATGGRLVLAVVGFAIALVSVVASCFIAAMTIGRGVDLTLGQVAADEHLRGQLEADGSLTEQVGADGIAGLPRTFTAAVQEQQRLGQQTPRPASPLRCPSSCGRRAR